MSSNTRTRTLRATPTRSFRLSVSDRGYPCFASSRSLLFQLPEGPLVRLGSRTPYRTTKRPIDEPPATAPEGSSPVHDREQVHIGHLLVLPPLRGIGPGGGPYWVTLVGAG